MIKDSIKRYLSAKTNDKGVVFELNDFEGYLMNPSNLIGKNITYAIIILNKSLDKKIINEMRTINKFFFVASSFLDSNIILHLVNDRNDKSKEQLNSITNLLKSYDFKSQKGNIYGENEANKVISYDIKIPNYVFKGLKMEVNEDDYLKRQSAIQNAESARDVNLSKAITLSLVGGLLGAIPAFILMFFFNYMLFWAYALIPFLAIYLYKKAKGPNKNFAPILVTILTVFIVAGMTLSYYQLVATSEGYALMDFLNEFELMESFISDLMFSLGGSLFAIFLTWNYLKVDKQII